MIRVSLICEIRLSDLSKPRQLLNPSTDLGNPSPAPTNASLHVEQPDRAKPKDFPSMRRAPLRHPGGEAEIILRFSNL